MLRIRDGRRRRFFQREHRHDLGHARRPAKGALLANA
jgi:hypothetical protein